VTACHLYVQWEKRTDLGAIHTTVAMNQYQGVNPGGWGSQPPDFGQGVVRARRGVVGSWTSREILLYLIMYRKYVRKW